MATITDDFTGASGTIPGTTQCGFSTITRDGAGVAVGGDFAGLTYDAELDTTSQYAEIEIVTGTSVALTLCSNQSFTFPFADGYIGLVNGSSWELREPGGGTIASNSSGPSPSTGSVIRLEHTGGGALEMFHNGVSVVTGTAGTVRTDKHVGFQGNTTYDNFEAGDLGGGATASRARRRKPSGLIYR